MGLRLCSYNLEWFDDLFNKDATFKSQKARDRAESAAEVLKIIDADLVAIMEAPGTTKSTGKSTVTCLEVFAETFGLRQKKAIIGFPSNGRQEIAALYDPQKVALSHKPGGKSRSKKNPRFDKSFQHDSDADRVLEIYKHFRPPLEVEVERLDGGNSFRLIAVHAKSKGIFSKNDLIHYQREEIRNRRKLFAECSHPLAGGRVY
ncbi:MAG: hypothetical protein AAFU56_04255 [Pseudomonadota bacterium]